MSDFENERNEMNPSGPAFGGQTPNTENTGANGTVQNPNAYTYQGGSETENAGTGATNPAAGQAHSYTQPYFYPDPYSAPVPPKPKKPKKGVSRGVFAVVVVLCVLLSGAAGAAGSIWALHYAGNLQNGSSGTVKGGTTVVYRAPEQTADQVSAAESDDVTVRVAAIASPSVVEITTETVVTSSFYRQYVTSGAGSGVILSSDGYIITCAHVISGASTVTVRLTNGDSYTAEVVGSDSQTDIAVLKIDVTELPAATVGNSGNLQVGQTSVAIGNPLGSLGGTVTSGIISALDREISIDGQKYNLLQTSASINPGNSGGGLFDENGNLIGIVNAKSSGTGIEGLGFAIPIDTAMKIAEELMQNGYVTGRPSLGITVVPVTSSTNLWSIRASDYAAILNYVNEYGVYFAEYQGGQSGDLRFGDRIVAINGTTISSTSDITSALESYKVGDTVTITVARIDDISSRNPKSKMVDVSLTLVEKSVA